MTSIIFLKFSIIQGKKLSFDVSQLGDWVIISVRGILCIRFSACDISRIVFGARKVRRRFCCSYVEIFLGKF